MKDSKKELQKETKLVQRILAKDKFALREFYLAHASRLLNYIRKKITEEKDVEEIAQDVLFAFLDGLRDFQGGCRLNTYLCSIANHKIIDHYRKRKIKKVLFSQFPEGLEPLVSELSDPQKTFDQALLIQKINKVFTKLAPHYAQILKLKYIEDRSVTEISKILAISFKSAESILFRARKSFVKAYAET